MSYKNYYECLYAPQNGFWKERQFTIATYNVKTNPRRLWILEIEAANIELFP